MVRVDGYTSVTPHLVEDILSRHDGAVVLREHLHDHGFLVGQRVFDAVPSHGVIREEINFIAAEAQGRCGPSVPMAAAQDGGDPQQQFP